jgi:hypothetical protein
MQSDTKLIQGTGHETIADKVALFWQETKT